MHVCWNCTVAADAASVDTAASVERKADEVADVGPSTTDGDDLGVTVERKLTSEVSETVTVTGAFSEHPADIELRLELTRSLNCDFFRDEATS